MARSYHPYKITSEVHISQTVNIGQISKIVNFHPIDFDFEEELHIWSMNSPTKYFWGQIRFVHFASIMLCTTSSSWFLHLSCLFACRFSGMLQLQKILLAYQKWWYLWTHGWRFPGLCRPIDDHSVGHFIHRNGVSDSGNSDDIHKPWSSCGERWKFWSKSSPPPGTGRMLL